MSGIAEILHNLGYKVQGSDQSANANVERLKGLGIKVMVGQKEENIISNKISVVVRSSAVKDDNPEIKAARKGRIPVIQRAEMLAELMRLKSSIAVAGTHGKTTTTSMVTAIFEAEGRCPTVINGGIINAYGTNAHLGSGQWLIAEADESDGSFLKLPSTIGVITNIDPEHMEHYGSFDNLKSAFKAFIDNLPFYGFGVLCNDHPEVAALIPQITDRKIVSYGLDTEADIVAKNIRYKPSGSTYDVHIKNRVQGGERVLRDVILPMPGKHNISNSLAAVAIAAELGFKDESIVGGFKQFAGVKRRFTKTGEVNGVTIIDDYGHHPTEIAVTLQTARQVIGNSDGRIIAVAQPHRYSRVHDLFDQFSQCFSDANIVIIADIYEAGESPIAGIDKEHLVKAIKANGHPDVQILPSAEDLPKLIAKLAKSGDMVICMGAGTISGWANDLPKNLKAL
ncbi:UDP-N-acetylmuramate--L-alanine ligase, partial [Rickettsiales bacterium]|nr:UDP-N-acetylmuramate--L-alanine ligase [Rickettsiales bacterium]